MSKPNNDPSSIFDLDRLPEYGLKSLRFQIEMESTNDVALEWLLQDSVELPALVLTEAQRAGRGRGNNRWETSQGALTFSLILPPSLKPQLTLLSLATGFSIVRMIEAASELQAHLKWPNDVLVAGKKIAGILIETTSNGIVVGIGINVNNEPSLETATSLQEQTGQSQDLQGTLAQMLQFFFETLDQTLQQPQQLVEQCENRLAFMNGEIELRVGSEQMSGVLKGLDPSGGLQLETPAGLKTILSATQIRPKQ